MKNLKDTGLVLKTIKPGLSYEELLTELNYNFEQLLHHPGFKGIPGDTIVGPPGQSTRGSKWVFVDFVKFHTVYPFVNSSDQLNLTFINSEFANSPDKFYSAIYIPNDTQLIVGDIIVLPSGNILELVNLNGEILFVDTLHNQRSSLNWHFSAIRLLTRKAGFNGMAEKCQLREER